MNNNQIIIASVFGISIIIFIIFLTTAISVPVIFLLSLAWPLISYQAAERYETDSKRKKTYIFILFFGIYYLLVSILLFSLQSKFFYDSLDGFIPILNIFITLHQSGVMFMTLTGIVIMIVYTLILVEEDTKYVVVSRGVVLFAFLTFLTSYLEFFFMLFRTLYM